jgi:hypothetical protein
MLSPLFHGDDLDQVALTAEAGARQADLLEVTYASHDRGHADLPIPASLSDCLARVRNHVTRDTGNFATFAARSGAAVQLLMEAGGRRWLETQTDNAPGPRPSRLH